MGDIEKNRDRRNEMNKIFNKIKNQQQEDEQINFEFFKIELGIESLKNKEARGSVTIKSEIYRQRKAFGLRT